jgi:hypothetical protein
MKLSSYQTSVEAAIRRTHRSVRDTSSGGSSSKSSGSSAPSGFPSSSSDSSCPSRLSDTMGWAFRRESEVDNGSSSSLTVSYRVKERAPRSSGRRSGETERVDEVSEAVPRDEH